MSGRSELILRLSGLVGWGICRLYTIDISGEQVVAMVIIVVFGLCRFVEQWWAVCLLETPDLVDTVGM